MSTNHSSSPAKLVALSAAVLLLNSACNAFSGDRNTPVFSSLIEPLFPPTPSGLASDLFNVYDADRRRRAVALFSASPFGSEQIYVQSYRLLIDDGDATVRAASAKALGMHGSVEDVEIIVPLLKDEEAFVRWEAAKALQRIHNPIATDPLVDTLRDDEDADVRKEAATALGQYAKPVVFHALVGALNDENFGVDSAASQSLVTLTGEELGNDGAAWLNWVDLHGSKLFDGQLPYGYQPYVKPRGIFDKMQFWKERKHAAPQPPTGLRAVTAPTVRPTG